MKTMKNNKNRKNNSWVKIFTLLSLIWMTIIVFLTSLTIFLTANKLIIINDNIDFYNESPRKTDSMTESVLEDFAAREELYNSNDIVVRLYSRSPLFLKLTITAIAVASIIFIPYLYANVFLYAIKYYIRKLLVKKKKKHIIIRSMN